MKVDPNVISDCGKCSGCRALDGLCRDIVVVTVDDEDDAPLHLKFDGVLFDRTYFDDLTGEWIYVDTADGSDLENFHV